MTDFNITPPIAFAILLGLALLGLFYLLIRNRLVCDFLEKMNKMCYNQNIQQINFGITPYRSAYDYLYKKLPLYDKLLFSLKRLKMEKHLDDETINTFNDINDQIKTKEEEAKALLN